MALILIADDEALMRAALRRILEHAGHRVQEAVDGDACMKRFREVRPDLVVTDIIMPHRDGLEVILELRRMDLGVPIIATTSGGSVGTALCLKLAHEFGATRTLTKPLDEDELVRTVAQCVAGIAVEAGLDPRG